MKSYTQCEDTPYDTDPQDYEEDEFYEDWLRGDDE